MKKLTHRHKEEMYFRDLQRKFDTYTEKIKQKIKLRKKRRKKLRKKNVNRKQLENNIEMKIYIGKINQEILNLIILIC